MENENEIAPLEQAITERLENFNNETDINKKLEILIDIIKLCRDEYRSLDEAFKYASLAAVMTESPRADICCILGELYNMRKNAAWSKKWFEHAINNVSANIDTAFYTWYPILMIGNIYANDGDIKNAEKYFNAVSIFNPNYLSKTTQISELI